MRKSSKAAMKTALLGSVLASLMSAPALAQTGQTDDGEDIIVTATKREEAVRDISGSVSAYTGEQLEELGAEGMEDYITRTPGVVFNQGTPGGSTVTVRGVSVGLDQGQGTTGYFINEVPLTDPGFSIGTPDIDTFDVENVAILRGPQGTLFGSGALGGAINYQAARPDLAEVDVRLQGTAEVVEEGATGRSGRVMLNVPVVENTLALRGVYSNREIAGYIDNVGTGQDDANRTRIRGGRFQALWQPTPDTAVNYLYLEQETDTRDAGSEEIAEGPLTRSSLVPEPSRFNTLLHNIRLDQDFSFGTLTAMATLHRKEQASLDDSTNDLLPVLQSAFGLPLTGGPITIGQTAESEGTTFEIRLASEVGGRFDYVIGFMHDQTDQDIDTSVIASGVADVLDAVLGPGSGAALTPGDSILNAQTPVSSEESALFGEGTLHLNDRWKVTLGGRAFRQELSSTTTAADLIPIFLGTAGTTTGPSAEEEGFNPKASITWAPNEDFMAYALVSKGFRAGGPNIVPDLGTDDIPRNWESDSLINYEIGFRADLFDSRLLLDMTGFYIDWDNIQLRRSTSTLLNFGVNAGRAEIYGLETSATLHVTDNLDFSSAITYLDASLADGLPGSSGSAPISPGGRLPGSSEWLVSNVLSYEWSAGLFEPSIVLSHRFVGEAPSTVGGGPAEGDYNLFDARFRLDTDHFGITAFVDNFTDERGVVSGNASSRTFVRPRTIGLTLDYRL